MNLGHPEPIAEAPDDYVRIAVDSRAICPASPNYAQRCAKGCSVGAHGRPAFRANIEKSIATFPQWCEVVAVTSGLLAASENATCFATIRCSNEGAHFSSSAAGSSAVCPPARRRCARRLRSDCARATSFSLAKSA